MEVDIEVTCKAQEALERVTAYMQSKNWRSAYSGVNNMFTTPMMKFLLRREGDYKVFKRDLKSLTLALGLKGVPERPFTEGADSRLELIERVQ